MVPAGSLRQYHELIPNYFRGAGTISDVGEFDAILSDESKLKALR
jgi:hypothetical protein